MTPSGASAGYWTRHAPVVVLARPMRVLWQAEPSSGLRDSLVVSAQRAPRGLGGGPPRAPLRPSGNTPRGFPASQPAPR